MKNKNLVRYIAIEGSNGSGKSTCLSLLNVEYKIPIKKSVSEWFYKYIPDVRDMSPESELYFYRAAHVSSVLDSEDNRLQIFDRSIISTIIRICYSNKNTVNEAIDIIKNELILPDIVIVLECSADTCISRIKKRNNLDKFDINLGVYEKNIYKELPKIVKHCFYINTEDTILHIASKINDIYNQFC